MSEKTNLSLTKEQVEAFAKWKQEYTNAIKLAEGVLHHVLGIEGVNESQIAKNLQETEKILEQFNIAEDYVKYGEDEITSDMGLGFQLSNYQFDLETVLFDKLDSPTGGLKDWFYESRGRLLEIFNLEIFNLEIFK